MPLLSSMYVSPEEMAREAMKLTEVLARVLSKENPRQWCPLCHGHYPPTHWHFKRI